MSVVYICIAGAWLARGRVTVTPGSGSTGTNLVTDTVGDTV